MGNEKYWTMTFDAIAGESIEITDEKIVIGGHEIRGATGLKYEEEDGQGENPIGTLTIRVLVTRRRITKP